MPRAPLHPECPRPTTRPARIALGLSLVLSLLGGAAHAGDLSPATDAPAPQNTRRPVVSPREAITFGAVLGTLAVTDHPLWRLFDTDLGQPAASRDHLADRVSWLGDGRVLLLASALPMVLDGKHGRQTTTRAVKALATTTVAVNALKFLVGKERPGQSGGQIRFRGPGLGDASFPSGHAAAAFAAATIMADAYPHYRYVFWGLAALVGLARVQAGAHFPSDVFAGAGLGTYLGRRALRGNTHLLSWSF